MQKEAYIWGAGHYGVLTALYCEQNGIKVIGFIDTNASQIATRLGLPVLEPNVLQSNSRYVIIAVKDEPAINVIKNILEKLESKECENFEVSKIVEKDQKTKDAFAPGHYYSPIPLMEDIKKHNFNISLPKNLSGIDLNDNEQLELLNSFEPFYRELPFTDEKADGLRYYYKNRFYTYSDAIFLYCMIRHLKPKKIIEVGSGFSSSLILDVNEKFMRNSTNCIFIEPNPERLESLLRNNDKENVLIHKARLQEIPLETFKELNKNDILFIDSTHVTKFNSDVNYIFHEILPILANGVYIHFHDVFYPFEYPQEWLLSGRAWSEQYMLRAFLEYNKSFKIVLFNTYLQNIHEAKIKNRFPLIYKEGLVVTGSIWIKRNTDEHE
jgi:predicted O-methyltransferase YrrM